MTTTDVGRALIPYLVREGVVWGPATPRRLNEPSSVSREETVSMGLGSDRERSQGFSAFAPGHVAIERAKTSCG
jgi:hypothetical protein